MQARLIVIKPKRSSFSAASAAALLLAVPLAAPASAAPAPARTAAPRAGPGAAAPSSPPAGKLVVLVVVDQLRYQDLLWLAPALGPRGFAGLGRPAPLRYDTAVTETAADHAVLSTGAYADLNGIVGNRFWEGGREHESVEDPGCPIWGAERSGRSAAMLRVPTVGDGWKLGTNGAGRVISIAVKDRTALFLGGPAADLALWFEVETGELTSSSCYGEAPPPWLVALRAAHPVSEWKDWVWELAHPDLTARLVPSAATDGAFPRHGLGATFPHRVGQGAVDKRLFNALRNSPAGTTIVLQAARAAVRELRLGESGTDFLALGLSAVDGVGHQFGTLARERVDTVLRVHDELGAFLDELRARHGAGLSVVLTADHGLTPIEKDQRRLRVSQGGTIDLDALIARLNRALDEQLGARREGWVATIDGSALTLRPPFPARAVLAAVQLLRAEPGFWKVIPESEVAQAESFVRHAYFPGRSGQVLLVPRPLWTLKKPSDGADHGSPWNDDALVPFLVESKRARLKAQDVLRATQVAPTLALLLETAPPSAALDSPAVERE